MSAVGIQIGEKAVITFMLILQSPSPYWQKSSAFSGLEVTIVILSSNCVSNLSLRTFIGSFFFRLIAFLSADCEPHVQRIYYYTTNCKKCPEISLLKTPWRTSSTWGTSTSWKAPWRSATWKPSWGTSSIVATSSKIATTFKMYK